MLRTGSGLDGSQGTYKMEQGRKIVLFGNIRDGGTWELCLG